MESPYPGDIAPQESVRFEIESSVATSDLLRYTVGSWDHSIDSPGPAYRDDVLAPSIQAVPEPGSLLFFGVAIGIGVAGCKWGGWKRPS
jgi:hypothetical protein